MFKKLSVIALVFLSCITSTTFGQQHNAKQEAKAVSGKIRILIDPSAVETVRALFHPLAEQVESKSANSQQLTLSSETAIREALEIPQTITGLSLRPFSATHSIAFEAMRERMNPQLFRNNYSITTNESVTALRIAEDKLSRWFELEYNNAASPEVIAAQLKRSSKIVLAEPVFVRYPLYIPNDTLFPEQYPLPMMHVPEAWDIARCDSTMLTAVVDVSVDWSHKDLINAIHINKGEIGTDINGVDKRYNGVDDDGNGYIDDWHGWDFDGVDGSSPDNDSRAPTAHGTHVAGILAATGDNKEGIAGVAFGAKVIPLKASDNSGATLDFGFEGIIYATDMGAKVINCSWGGPSRSQAEQDVIEYAYNKNSMVVAASGNNGMYENYYPASYNHVISVAAVSNGGNTAGFSDYGPKVDVAAPGVLVISTVPGDNYSWESGTSMSSPHASGALALIRFQHPELSAGQAAELMRVTSTPMVEANGIFFGHGRIDLAKALTTTHAHSARIEEGTIEDQSGNGALEKSENASIRLLVRNYLDSVNDLKAKVEIIQGGEHVKTTADIIHFGKTGTLGLLENLKGEFPISADDSVTPNTEVLVKLTFYDSTVGYYDDIDFYSFSVSADYLDLTRNNLRVSIDSKGGIGYNDPPINSQGSGFVWVQAPPEIKAQGKSVLYNGGLMAGVSPTRVVSIAPSPWSSNLSDLDFLPVMRVQDVSHPEDAAVQELEAIYADSIADPSRQVGVTVHQRSYAINKGLAQNAIILNYVIKKRATVLDSLPTDNTSIALYMDWDVGIGGGSNRAYLADDGITAVTQRLEPGYPIVGMRLLSPLPSGASVQYYAINNNGSDNSLSIYDGFSTDEKWQSLSEPRLSAGVNDISQVYGLKNLPLLSSDSIELTYVIGLATDIELLNQTLDLTEKAYKNLFVNAVQASSERLQQLSVYPNPFNDHLQLSWNSPEKDRTSLAQIEVFDMLGRKLFEKKTNGNSMRLGNLQLPNGVYLISVKQGSTEFRKQINSLR